MTLTRLLCDDKRLNYERDVVGFWNNVNTFWSDCFMCIIERSFTVAVLIFISIAAIGWIGKEFYALLAMFELMVGIIIGLTIFLPNKVT